MASLPVEHDGVRVGLCPVHLKERVRELAEHWPAVLGDEIAS